MAETGWQAHSVRGALSGNLKTQLKLDVRSEKTDAGRVYRIVDTKRITSDKRGVGAAVMTMRDAATLLLGAYGDISPQHAHDAADRLRTLEPLPQTRFDKDKRKELGQDIASEIGRPLVRKFEPLYRLEALLMLHLLLAHILAVLKVGRKPGRPSDQQA